MQNWHYLGTIFGRLYVYTRSLKWSIDIWGARFYQPDTDYIKRHALIDHSNLFCSNSSLQHKCYTWGSEIWDLHAKLGLFWDQIWTLVPFGTKSQIWDFIIAPGFKIEVQACSPSRRWYIVYVQIGHSQDWQSVTSVCLPFSASSEGRIRNLGLGRKIGTFWDHFYTLVLFGTKSRIRDFIGAPACILWMYSALECRLCRVNEQLLNTNIVVNYDV